MRDSVYLPDCDSTVNVVLVPTVTVVSAPQFFPHPSYPIPADGDDATRLGSFSGKGCYRSWGEGGRPNVENQRRIIQERHGSVLQHINFSLYIEGISRNLSLELNRHSTGIAISQESTRYVGMEDTFLVLEPLYAELFRTNRAHPLVAGHIHSFCECQRQYTYEVQQLEKLNPRGLTGVALRKWARGKARNCLPGGMETRGVWTGNLRAWRYIIEERSSRFAEEEIRRLAKALFEALSLWAPLYFEDYTPVEIDGWPEYQTPNRKV